MDVESTPAISGKEKYENYYLRDDRHEEWLAICARAKADNIVRLCSDVPHEKVLEIGCGSGSVLEQLDRRSFARQMTGIEISSSGMERLRAKEIPSLKEAVLFDGERVPFAGKAFDLAILSHVVEHLDNPRGLLREAGRVASHVFVEVPLEHTIRLQRDFDFNDVGHINYFKATTFRRLIQTSGLVVERQIVANTSLEALRFQKGSAGALQHHVREGVLKIFPGLAQQFFVYHSALLAKPV